MVEYSRIFWQSKEQPWECPQILGNRPLIPSQWHKHSLLTSQHLWKVVKVRRSWGDFQANHSSRAHQVDFLCKFGRFISSLGQEGTRKEKLRNCHLARCVTEKCSEQFDEIKKLIKNFNSKKLFYWQKFLKFKLWRCHMRQVECPRHNHFRTTLWSPMDKSTAVFDRRRSSHMDREWVEESNACRRGSIDRKIFKNFWLIFIKIRRGRDTHI